MSDRRAPDRRDPTRQSRHPGGRRLTDLDTTDGYVTVAVVASYLKVTPRTVWKWHEAGLLPISRFPGNVNRVHVEDLRAFITDPRTSPLSAES